MVGMSVNDPIQMGQELMVSGNYYEAQELFAQILAEDPDNDTALYHLGLCHLACDRLTDAERCFRRCLDINPRNVDALVDLGETEFAGGDAKQASATFAKAVEMSPEYARPYVSLARVQDYLGQDDEAIGNFERAMEISDPGEAPTYDLALVYAKVGRYLRADILLENLISETLRRGSQSFAGETSSRDDITEFIQDMKTDREHIHQLFEEEHRFSLDVARYMFQALSICQHLKGDQIKAIAAEIRLLRYLGLQGRETERGLRLNTLDGSFNGLQLECFLHAFLCQVGRSEDRLPEYAKAYDMALELFAT